MRLPAAGGILPFCPQPSVVCEWKEGREVDEGLFKPHIQPRVPACAARRLC